MARPNVSPWQVPATGGCQWFRPDGASGFFAIRSAYMCCSKEAIKVANETVRHVTSALREARSADHPGREAEQHCPAAFVRDIFNPFAPITPDVAYLTPNAVVLARTM